ncbi:hypothetical protein DPMN_151022 [Dreissena polymorpha]|uniref:Uncharacterized protein n=1 Tax=Dreissena polymorpha TaxID=45954 RepID=A0A9D4FIR3_DREPO|nr:hypothetical protein DPMN_151022 [Dreissena polymorpha]
MDTILLGLFILFACTGTVTCLEYCYTGPAQSEYCTYYCCTSSYSIYDYCCTTRFEYWMIAPIVIGVIIFISAVVFICTCCCKTVNGMTRYQSWTARRVGGTTIATATSVNQQTMMNNISYPPQQAYQGYHMYQQPYQMGQQPYAPVSQFGGLQIPTQSGGPGPQFGASQIPTQPNESGSQFGGPQIPAQPGGSQPSVPPPYSVSYGQDPSFPPKY